MNILNPRRNERGSGPGIFRMEFPLAQWLIACLYKAFGNHLILSRLFMFLVGIGSIMGIYKILSVLFKNKIIAITGVWAFTFSPIFYYYTINPLPDNLALCIGIWGLALLFLGYESGKKSPIILSGLFLGIGALCKLPFILYFAAPITLLIIELRNRNPESKLWFPTIGSIFFITLPILWYSAVIPEWSNNSLKTGLIGNEKPFLTLLDYFQHNVISTIPELFINHGALIFFLAGVYFFFKRKAFRDSRFIVLLATLIAIIGYFLFELNMIAKVHDYYLFPFFPFLIITVAYGCNTMLSSRPPFVRYLSIALLLALPLVCYSRMKGRWNENSPGFNKDLLVYKKELRNAVPNDALVVAGNDESHFIFFYYIDKKGWGFHGDELLPEKLANMIHEGARYLYCDSRLVDRNMNIAKFIDRLIISRGSISVYSLKINPSY